MPHRPSFDQFAELARTHTVVPVYRRLVADALTPVSAFWAIREPGGCFLFESVVGGERIGRYSFLGAGPFKTFEAYGNQVRRADGTEYTSADPLQDFETSLAEYQSPNLPELPRFCGGAVGYAGYDTVRYVERLPNAPPDDRHVPDLSFGFYDRMVIFDHITKVVFAVAHAHVGGDRGSGMGYRAAYDDACRRVDELVAKLTRPPTDLPLADIDPPTRLLVRLPQQVLTDS